MQLAQDSNIVPSNSVSPELVCNICEGSEFKEGPQGRLSVTGRKPTCSTCGSLERHRILRSVWKLIPTSFLENKRALQFSIDPSVERKWFKEVEVSIYEHTNSIDIQKIDREDESYDVVICNQIIEHVADDRAAFSELMRLLSPNGFFQMTVPNPILRQTTEDWGYPKDDFHGHYRHYGIDLIEHFHSVVPDAHMVNVKTVDVISDSKDYVFFWTKSKTTMDLLVDSFEDHLEITHRI